jgi:hypothetical protein
MHHIRFLNKDNVMAEGYMTFYDRMQAIGAMLILRKLGMFCWVESL